MRGKASLHAMQIFVVCLGIAFFVACVVSIHRIASPRLPEQATVVENELEGYAE